MSRIQTIRNNIEQHYKQQQIEKDRAKANVRNSRWNKYYDNKYWHTLRDWKICENPLCEVCEAKGVVEPAEHVHHITKFSSGITDEAKWRLLLNKKNLLSTCKLHHKLAHMYMDRNNTDTAGINEILQMDKDIG